MCRWVIPAGMSAALLAQTPAPAPPPPANHPKVSVRGRSYTPKSILSRNMGTREDQQTQFPPHKVIGNIYYVGTKTLSSFLMVTPQGNILVNTTYERSLPAVQKSVDQLGFKFSDIKIVLGTHAHGDHQEADAMVKQATGAQFVAMAEDVPALKAMKPGGKEHPVDRVIHDGDTVSLGGVTLTAHLTPGHTRGCTTWTLKAEEGGKIYDVVIGGSLRPPATVTPEVAAEFNKTYPLVRSLACDVPLGDHPAQYRMLEKYAKLKKGAANPFLDRAGCVYEADIEEAMFHALQKEQAASAK